MESSSNTSPKPRRRLLRYLLLATAVAVLAVAACNGWMLKTADERIHRNAAAAPKSSAAIVLGTTPGAKDAPNVFFTNRMDAAAAVWKAGKVHRIIVSGDNRWKDYDEPTSMLKALVARGVPADVIVRDYAGLRTLDTMFRAAKVFNVADAILVTDDWHLPRALFLADHAGIQCSGVASAPVPWSRSPTTRIREYLSRVKAALDIYVLNTKPRFSD
jgi:SanA protein